MTLKIKSGYRLNVAMIVLNKDNRVLFNDIFSEMKFTVGT